MICFSTSVTSPGTPQRLMANASPIPPQVSGVLAGNSQTRGTSITFQSSRGNTAAKAFYIGTTPAMSIAARTGIGLEILTGTAQAAIYPAGATSVDDLFIDTDGVAGDKLYVTVA